MVHTLGRAVGAERGTIMMVTELRRSRGLRRSRSLNSEIYAAVAA